MSRTVPRHHDRVGSKPIRLAVSHSPPAIGRNVARPRMTGPALSGWNAMSNETMTPIELLLRKDLPYEINMLEHTFRLLSSDDYAKNLRKYTVVANALVELFWTHARNLIEFFNKGRGDGLTGLASAQDMTEGYFADTKMKGLDYMIKYRDAWTLPVPCTNDYADCVGNCFDAYQVTCLTDMFAGIVRGP
jgi:hypothetical protein